MRDPEWIRYACRYWGIPTGNGTVAVQLGTPILMISDLFGFVHNFGNYCSALQRSIFLCIPALSRIGETRI